MLVQQIAGMVRDPKTNHSVLSRWWGQQNDDKKESRAQLVHHRYRRRSNRPSRQRLGFRRFLDFAGVPCISMSFGAHTAFITTYDNFYWMEKFGDPEFHHAAMTITGLMAMTLADRR
jgi:hypothetical protein